MKPGYRIIADNADITARIQDRLQRLQVVDEAGQQSDVVTIALDNRDNLVAAPRTGAELEVFIGYHGTGLARMGLYKVDEVSSSGPPRSMTIQATSADMRASLKQHKTRPWDNATLGSIVSTIAGEHGLTAKASSALAGIAVDHLDQTEESDMHFLTRLAKDYDAVAKPAGAALLFVPRGEAQSVTGRTMPTIQLSASELSDWSATAEGRAKYQSVKAFWHNKAAAARQEVFAGSGDPVFTISRTFATPAEAQAAARGKLDELERGTGSLSAAVAVGRPELAAEAQVQLSGADAIADGLWGITRAEHILDGKGGYVTRITAETPKGSPKGLV